MKYETPDAVLIARSQQPIMRSNQNDKRSDLERLIYGLAFDDSDCWYWRGSHTNLGYGVIAAAGEKRAHRAAWVLWNGSIPEGMSVLHRCDVRCCVNPDHLFLGTHKDNMQDMTKKGRGKVPGLCGDSSPVRKLDARSVSMIRQEYGAGGISQSKLAKKFGVAQATINRILTRKAWRHENV